jgi:hypothetical protein
MEKSTIDMLVVVAMLWCTSAVSLSLVLGAALARQMPPDE